MKSIKAIFSLLLLALMFACSNGPSPTEVAVASSEAWANGDMDEYFEYMVVTDEERATLERLFNLKGQSIAEKNKARGGAENIEVISEEMTDGEMICKVVVEITFKDGTTKTEDVMLENIDDEWYLLNPLRGLD